MQTYAVIVAGGSGTRMGADRPKQFLELMGKPLLVHTVARFLDAFPTLQPVIVLPADWMDQGREILGTYFPSTSFAWAVGGETRFHSVGQGLAKIGGEGIVFVHDAVRCLVSVSLIRRCYEAALQSGAAVPAVPVRDSLRVLTGEGHQSINRELVRAIQTPQTFQLSLLREAFTQPYRPSFTDEATVMESAGHSVTLVEGEETNIKVTYPADLILADALMRENEA